MSHERKGRLQKESTVVGILKDSCSQPGIRSLGGHRSDYRNCEGELGIKVKEGNERHGWRLPWLLVASEGPQASTRPPSFLSIAFKKENSYITRIPVLKTVLPTNQTPHRENMESWSGGRPV